MEELNLVNVVIQSIIAGAVAGVTFVATVKTELKYLRRDIDMAHARLDHHEERHHA